jgi:hypothetical protein
MTGRNRIVPRMRDLSLGSSDISRTAPACGVISCCSDELANHGLRAYSQSSGFFWNREKEGFLTNDELKASYVVIRHNVRTYESAGVVEVVKGRANAESTLKKFENEQSSADRHEGWRYFLEKSTLKAGTDPTEATELRQAELESRESKATQDAGPNGGGFSR